MPSCSTCRTRRFPTDSGLHRCRLSDWQLTGTFSGIIIAIVCGALLFQEVGNREIRGHFQQGKEYVAYAGDNLEPLLEHYLSHEDERRAIAAAGQRRAQDYCFERLWNSPLELIEKEWSEILD